MLEEATMSQTVFFCNFDFFVDEPKLRVLFSSFGKILNITLMKDLFSKTSKGQGFIEFDHEEDAVASIGALNGSSQSGRIVTVREPILSELNLD